VRAGIRTVDLLLSSMVVQAELPAKFAVYKSVTREMATNTLSKRFVYDPGFLL